MTPERKDQLDVSVSAAVYIVDEEGRLLLLKQAAPEKGGKWGPPGGGIKSHEDPIDVAKRETREEIGVEVELMDLINIKTVDRGDTNSGLGFTFRGKISSGEVRFKDGEIADYKYFTPIEIRSLIKNDMLYKPEYNLDGIEDWLKGESYPLGVIKRMNH